MCVTNLASGGAIVECAESTLTLFSSCATPGPSAGQGAPGRFCIDDTHGTWQLLAERCDVPVIAAITACAGPPNDVNWLSTGKSL